MATGQVLAYMDITEEEQEELGKMPVVFNPTTGAFIIPPSNGVLKIGRHAYGYLNPTRMITTPLSALSKVMDTTNTEVQTIISYPPNISYRPNARYP